MDNRNQSRNSSTRRSRTRCPRAASEPDYEGFNDSRHDDWMGPKTSTYVIARGDNNLQQHLAPAPLRKDKSHDCARKAGS